MSTNENTPDAEPLHTATLLAVLAKLRDRLTAIPALIAEDTADHPLTDCEVAEWNARVEALEVFAADVAVMLLDANPRARVVVLPEKLDRNSTDRNSTEARAHFPGGVTGHIGDQVGIAGMLGRHESADATALALSILAAAEFAGGAK